MRDVVALCLVFLLSAPPLPAAEAGKQTPREQALAIARGEMVEVRMVEGGKLRGRIGPVTDVGFEMETQQKGKLETQQVAFARVKSIRATHRSFERSLGRGFLIGAIVVVTIAVIFGILCHENLCSG
jgi:hypothetical protein